MYFDTGSFGRINPSSIIIIAATPRIGFVDDIMHGSFCLDIHEAVRLEVNHFAAARNGRDRTLDVAGVDVTLHRRIDPLQSLGRHPDRLGFGNRNLRTAECEPREGQRCCKPGSQLHRNPPIRHTQDSAAVALCQPNEYASSLFGLATGHLAHEQVHRLELLGVLAEGGVRDDDLVDADLLESADDVPQLRRRTDDDPTG